MVSIDKKGEAFASPFLSINVEGSVFLPAGLHNAWQFSLVSSFTQLVTAKSKVAINTRGLPVAQQRLRIRVGALLRGRA